MESLDNNDVILKPEEIGRALDEIDYFDQGLSSSGELDDYEQLIKFYILDFYITGKASYTELLFDEWREKCLSEIKDILRRGKVGFDDVQRYVIEPIYTFTKAGEEEFFKMVEMVFDSFKPKESAIKIKAYEYFWASEKKEYILRYPKGVYIDLFELYIMHLPNKKIININEPAHIQVYIKKKMQEAGLVSRLDRILHSIRCFLNW